MPSSIIDEETALLGSKQSSFSSAKRASAPVSRMTKAQVIATIAIAGTLTLIFCGTALYHADPYQECLKSTDPNDNKVSKQSIVEKLSNATPGKNCTGLSHSLTPEEAIGVTALAAAIMGFATLIAFAFVYFKQSNDDAPLNAADGLGPEVSSTQRGSSTPILDIHKNVVLDSPDVTQQLS